MNRTIEDIANEVARVSNVLAETVAARDRAHNKIIGMGARLHDLETERAAHFERPRAQQADQARALISLWRQCANRTGCTIRRLVYNECAHELEDALSTKETP